MKKIGQPPMASCSGKKSKADEITEAASAGNVRRIKKLAKEFNRGKGIAETVASIRDSDGKGVLHAAAIKGRTNVCKYLLEELKLQIDEKDGEDCTPLLHASLEGHLSTVEYLIKSGADLAVLNKHSTTALHLATLEGHIEIIHLLLSRGADANAPSVLGTPLQVATQNCNPDILKVLLSHGASPNVIGVIPTPLDFSLSRSMECTELLLQAGADPNGISCGKTPLALAARDGQHKVIKCLLEAGADPNIVDDTGLLPIELAARNGNYQEVGILFPVTSPIPACSDWSFAGIIQYVHSESFTQKVKSKIEEKHSKAISHGEDALKNKDYPLAAFYFTEAIASDPFDAAALSSRSLCYTCLGDGDAAWADAKACMLLKPLWPYAYYRGGIALILLENYNMATETILMGLRLDPENKDLKDAYQLASEAKMCAKMCCRHAYHE